MVYKLYFTKTGMLIETSSNYSLIDLDFSADFLSQLILDELKHLKSLPVNL